MFIVIYYQGHIFYRNKNIFTALIDSLAGADSSGFVPDFQLSLLLLLKIIFIFLINITTAQLCIHFACKTQNVSFYIKEFFKN